MQVDFLLFLGCSKKQIKLQIDEILNFFTFFVDGHLKFTYALSTSKAKIIIYQFFNVKLFWTQIHHSISKIFWLTFDPLKFG
jgi:hypothetical protein